MSEDISYQNKDILFKILSEQYKSKSFSAYGLDIPPIKALLPTNLPKITANEKSTDNLFLLADGTYAIVDYESEYKRTNKIKYMHYIARVMEKYLKEDETFNLRLIILYTGDVMHAAGTFETNCITLRTEQAFLFHIDSETELEIIRKKFSTGEPLTDSDLMKLVILPLTVPGVERKHRMLESVVTLAGHLPQGQQDFVISGAIVASDKFIQPEYRKQLRRLLGMTWLSEMYEKEKIEYGKQVAAQEKKRMAISLLNKDVDIIMIMEVTGLSEKEILSLKEEPVTA